MIARLHSEEHQQQRGKQARSGDDHVDPPGPVSQERHQRDRHRNGDELGGAVADRDAKVAVRGGEEFRGVHVHHLVREDGEHAKQDVRDVEPDKTVLLRDHRRHCRHWDQPCEHYHRVLAADRRRLHRPDHHRDARDLDSRDLDEEDILVVEGEVCIPLQQHRVRETLSEDSQGEETPDDEDEQHDAPHRWRQDLMHLLGHGDPLGLSAVKLPHRAPFQHLVHGAVGLGNPLHKLAHAVHLVLVEEEARGLRHVEHHQHHRDHVRNDARRQHRPPPVAVAHVPLHASLAARARFAVGVHEIEACCQHQHLPRRVRQPWDCDDGARPVFGRRHLRHHRHGCRQHHPHREPDEEAGDEELDKAARERARDTRWHEDCRVDVQDRLPPVAVAHVPAEDGPYEESKERGGDSDAAQVVVHAPIVLRQRSPDHVGHYQLHAIGHDEEHKCYQRNKLKAAPADGIQLVVERRVLLVVLFRAPSIRRRIPLGRHVRLLIPVD
mmetsp:Transcript_9210/g.22649  ORF Transcript_9210/g.22649 Transcript_9210/m.22649 type:complete len:495 (+) Transcript_9210:278-1762(+)